jgi:hypothetical protein
MYAVNSQRAFQHTVHPAKGKMAIPSICGYGSRNIKQRLQLLDQTPLIHRNIGPVEFLQGVDTLSRDERV